MAEFAAATGFKSRRSRNLLRGFKTAVDAVTRSEAGARRQIGHPKGENEGNQIRTHRVNGSVGDLALYH